MALSTRSASGSGSVDRRRRRPTAVLSDRCPARQAHRTGTRPGSTTGAVTRLRGAGVRARGVSLTRVTSRRSRRVPGVTGLAVIGVCRWRRGRVAGSGPSAAESSGPWSAAESSDPSWPAASVGCSRSDRRSVGWVGSAGGRVGRRGVVCLLRCLGRLRGLRVDLRHRRLLDDLRKRPLQHVRRIRRQHGGRRNRLLPDHPVLGRDLRFLPLLVVLGDLDDLGLVDHRHAVELFLREAGLRADRVDHLLDDLLVRRQRVAVDRGGHPGDRQRGHRGDTQRQTARRHLAGERVRDRVQRGATRQEALRIVDRLHGEFVFDLHRQPQLGQQRNGRVMLPRAPRGLPTSGQQVEQCVIGVDRVQVETVSHDAPPLLLVPHAPHTP